MPEEIPPPAPAAQGAATPPNAGGENGTKADHAFAELRTKLTERERENADLLKRLTDLERKDMDDKQRMEAELTDLRKQNQELLPLRDEHGRFQAGMEAECARALAKLPEDKRTAVETATKYAPLDQRLASIQAMSEIVAPPGRVGTHTQPHGATAPPPGAQEHKPLAPADVDKMSWKDAVMSQPNAGTDVTASLVAQVREMNTRLEQLTTQTTK